MIKENNSPLLLTCHPSKWLRRIVFIMYLLALVASVANGLNLFIKICLLIFIAGYYRLSVYGLTDINYKIRYSDASGWELANGREFTAINILQSTVMTTQMLFLHFNYASSLSNRLLNKQTLLILNDQLTIEEFRSLIVKIKITVIK